MEKYLSIIVSLLAISGHLQADPVSPDYDYGYHEFFENTGDLRQRASSVFNQLIPQDEKRMWSVEYEFLTKNYINLEWSSGEGNQHSRIFVSCQRGFNNASATWLYKDDFIDEDGLKHIFTIFDDQVLEEVVRDNCVKSISLSTVVSDFLFVLNYKTQIATPSTYPVTDMVWESVRDLWTQRFLNLHIPIQFEEKERPS